MHIHTEMTAKITASTRRFTLVELILVVFLILLVLSVIPGLFSGRSSGDARRIACCANLHSIGQALELYLQETNIHEPEYPPGFDSNLKGEGLQLLVADGYLVGETMRCPAAKGQQVGHYAYCGSLGMHIPSAHEAYEPDSGIVVDLRRNHGVPSKLINILRADLSCVMCLMKEDWGKVNNQRLALRAGVWEPQAEDAER